MTIAELTSLSYAEKIEIEHGLSSQEVEEHERELKQFYLDRQLDEEWNERNTEDLEQIVSSFKF